VPELPDLTVYLDALERRIVGHSLTRIDLVSPFLLRSVDPPLGACFGRRTRGLRLIGKRLVFELDDALYLVLHLMIAGRLRWSASPPKVNRRLTLAVFVFDSGALMLTEAGSKRRASLHVVRGAAALREFERGGLDPLAVSPETFAGRLRAENHTLKRALTDPRLFSGIGNAYSDEILHRARLSPLQLTSRLTDAQAEDLHRATQATLREWIARLRAETGEAFPVKVTAFREGMAVHGRYRLPCPACGTPVQRIRYADNETNYCPACQTGGKLLADRALSRLLREDWPRSLDELDERLEDGRRTGGEDAASPGAGARPAR